MINLTNMQKKVDKAMSVFTRIVDELNSHIDTLKGAIDTNNRRIATAQAENVRYGMKIDEYKALKNKVESIIK